MGESYKDSSFLQIGFAKKTWTVMRRRENKT